MSRRISGSQRKQRPCACVEPIVRSFSEAHPLKDREGHLLRSDTVDLYCARCGRWLAISLAAADRHATRDPVFSDLSSCLTDA